MKLTPFASRASIRAFASAAPTRWMGMPPKPMRETRRPVFPNVTYSICFFLLHNFIYAGTAEPFRGSAVRDHASVPFPSPEGASSEASPETAGIGTGSLTMLMCFAGGSIAGASALAGTP